MAPEEVERMATSRSKRLSMEPRTWKVYVHPLQPDSRSLGTIWLGYQHYRPVRSCLKNYPRWEMFTEQRGTTHPWTAIFHLGREMMIFGLTADSTSLWFGRLPTGQSGPVCYPRVSCTGSRDRWWHQGIPDSSDPARMKHYGISMDSIDRRG